MKLWLITQDENTGYDTYDSAVVAAETEEDARATHPDGSPEGWGRMYSTWAKLPQTVQVQCLGTADASISAGVLCASFNAG